MNAPRKWRCWTPSKKLDRIQDALEKIIEGKKMLKWLVDKCDNSDAWVDAFGIIEKKDVRYE